MSMKQEIETWVAALQHYDNNEFEESLAGFQPIADTSKILFNCGVIRATLGEHEAAIQYYERATALDQYLAVAYFQQGVSHFLLGDFEEAFTDFNNTLLYLRGNKDINYEQLGLKYKLHSCEALFNRGLCYIYLQQLEAGLSDLSYAVKEKATPDHDVIDEAIREKAEGYTVFSIPVGVLFRPSEAKVKNVRTRDYLGKARLVRAAENQDNTQHRRQVSADQWARDDRPPEKISYAATHLVRPGLSGRTRQQSEPPIHRNVFPPTPPPEVEKPAFTRQTGRASPDATTPGNRSSSLSRTSKPERLELGRAAFDRSQTSSNDQARRAPARSASERPMERHREYGGQDREGQTLPTRERLFGQLDHEGQQEAVVKQLSNSRNSIRSARQPWQQSPDPIEEEQEEDYFANNMMRNSNATVPSVRTESDRQSSYRRSMARSSVHRGSQVVLKIRAKVHFKDDTRFIIITPKTAFAEFGDQVAKKFGTTEAFKMKIKDEEGDMITMGDQDDLDMAVTMCKEAATKEGAEIAKMEVWVYAA